jgi:hypothetical protein
VMTTLGIFAPCRSHPRSIRCLRIHATSAGFISAKACFAVKLSRYESRLSPSIRRRPRLLPGQVTTTLEINPASISL